MIIRPATPSDLPALNAIYNEVLLHSTAIYQDQPVSLAERTAWFEARRRQGYPVLVALAGDDVAGWASFGDFRHGSGYRFTVEGSIHLRPASRRAGIGSALLRELMQQARSLGKRVVVAGIDSQNTASHQFLLRSGFQEVGHLPGVGFKFGRFLDLLLLQRSLDTTPQL